MNISFANTATSPARLPDWAETLIRYAEKSDRKVIYLNELKGGYFEWVGDKARSLVQTGPFIGVTVEEFKRVMQEEGRP
jgi:hypothetical protein